MLKYLLLVGLLLYPFRLIADTILVIESYHSEYLWDQSYKSGLEEVLASSYDLVYFEMDTKRLPESEFASQAEKAWSLYQDIAPTLVILADDNALKFLAPKFLKTKTPVVYLGINANPRKYGVADASNFSGVIERPLLRRSVLLLQKILPYSKALVLLDSKETSRVIKQDVFYNLDSIELAGTELDLKLVTTFDEWKHHVLTAKSKGYDVLIAGLYHTLVDKEGKHVDDATVIEWTSSNTDIPPFGFWDFSIASDKNIGGYVIFGYEEGKLAGQIALDVLVGGRTRVRPETGGQGRFMFSRSQLSKWGIELPEYIHNQAVFVD